MKKKLGWKFLDMVDGQIVSRKDKSPWVIGKWRKEHEPTEACKGLNCSNSIDDALSFVRGSVLARVEYSGKVIHSDAKITCQNMRILKAWHITAQAWAEYDKIRAQARAEYNKIRAQARAEYNKIRAQARAEYEKITAQALAEYEKITAQTWKKILKKLKPITS
jgi:cell division septum initiation protein DivIVA